MKLRRQRPIYLVLGGSNGPASCQCAGPYRPSQPTRHPDNATRPASDRRPSPNGLPAKPRSVSDLVTTTGVQTSGPKRMRSAAIAGAVFSTMPWSTAIHRHRLLVDAAVRERFRKPDKALRVRARGVRRLIPTTRHNGRSTRKRHLTSRRSASSGRCPVDRAVRSVRPSERRRGAAGHRWSNPGRRREVRHGVRPSRGGPVPRAEAEEG